jgi:transposase
MTKESNRDLKAKRLAEKNVFNEGRAKVTDELFMRYDFFDARDLMQVKYEMVRRVQKDGWSIMRACKIFGLSRPCFYDTKERIEQEGIAGLIPGKRGPRQGHKLSEEVMEYVEEKMREDSAVGEVRLCELIKERYGFSIHRRSIERSLERRKKNRKRVI